jgi:hypothetical protein
VRAPRELLSRGTDVALPVVRLGRRVHRLEEAVRENALLAVPLEEQVARLEQSLVPVLEALQDSKTDDAADERAGERPRARRGRRG